ncbi:MAG: Calx-beta domain-containing protein [Verrucomicrobiota bacterium]
MNRLFASILLIFALVAPLQAGNFIVRTTYDDGTALLTGTEGSFRQAIAYANAHPGTTIIFGLWNGEGLTFSFDSPLPAIIARSTTINGNSVTFYDPDGIVDPQQIRPDPSDPPDTSPVITLDFSSAGGDGLVFTGGTSTLTNLIIQPSNASNNYSCVRLDSNNNKVFGCYIGTDGMTNYGNTAIGITITGKSNQIGSATLTERNLIGGNSTNILISGSLATLNNIWGNYIGIGVDGATALNGDPSRGIVVDSGSLNNIGTTDAGKGNVISGHMDAGIELTNGATNNTVAKNLIGTDSDPSVPISISSASASVANQDGIRLTNGATNNKINWNVISGNFGNGIYSVGSGIGNSITYNSIGTTGTGADAFSIPNSGNGIDLHTTNSTIIWNNTISGNATGIALDSCYGTSVTKNKIGTDPLGSTADGFGNSGPGIYITSGTSNVIGDTSITSTGTNAYANSNIISGNSVGIFIDSSWGEKIAGNVIGTDITGTFSIPNFGTDNEPGCGIFAQDANNQTISGNLISGNAQDGIWLNESSGITVTKNKIGLDFSLSSAIGNGRAGIYISDGGSHFIGGSGSGNWISGNAGSGIELESSDNQIIGNKIGTDTSGKFAIANGTDSFSDAGILVLSTTCEATNNVIGSGNLVSGNIGDGIRLDGSGVHDNTVAGNTIGLALDGTSPLTNSGNGVGIYNGAHDNFIGQASLGINKIASDYDGIQVSGSDSANNSLHSYSILLTAASTGVPINLIADVSNPNASAPAPVLVTVDNLLNLAMVTGTYHGTPLQSGTIDLYKALPGKAVTWFKSLPFDTDAAGNCTFSTQLGSGFGGQTLYAIAIDSTGATSEFSNGLLIPMRYRLAATTATVSENVATGNLAVVVYRDGYISTSGTLTLTTQKGGTAKPGIDFGTLNSLQDLALPVVFKAGATSGTAIIPIINNSKANGERSFVATLARKPGAVMNPRSITVNITDAQAPAGLIGFASPTVHANESAKAVVFTVVRSGGLGKTATVKYTLTPGSAQTPTNFTVPKSNVISFSAYQTAAIVVIPVIPHAGFDQPKAFTMTLSSPSLSPLATLPNSTALPKTATATIYDDSNSKGALQFSASNLTVQENDGYARLTITRLGGSSGSASVRYTTSNLTAISGTDYKAASGTVSFAAKQLTASVSIPILNDNVFEQPETFRVTLSSPVNATLAAQNTVDVTVVDDDNPDGVLEFASSGYSATEASGTATLTVKRLGGADSVVSVQYSTAKGSAVSGSDFGNTIGTLTFYAGQRTATIRVPIIRDALIEPAETFTVALSNPTNGAMLGLRKTATVTILAN